MPQLTILPNQQIYPIKAGTEFTHLEKLYPNLALKFGCRNGNCGVCVIRILENQTHLSPPTKQEIITLNRLKIDDSCRLACQCAIIDSVVIERSI